MRTVAVLVVCSGLGACGEPRVVQNDRFGSIYAETRGIALVPAPWAVPVESDSTALVRTLDTRLVAGLGNRTCAFDAEAGQWIADFSPPGRGQAVVGSVEDQAVVRTTDGAGTDRLWRIVGDSPVEMPLPLAQVADIASQPASGAITAIGTLADGRCATARYRSATPWTDADIGLSGNVNCAALRFLSSDGLAVRDGRATWVRIGRRFEREPALDRYDVVAWTGDGLFVGERGAYSLTRFPTPNGLELVQTDAAALPGSLYSLAATPGSPSGVAVVATLGEPGGSGLLAYFGPNGELAAVSAIDAVGTVTYTGGRIAVESAGRADLYELPLDTGLEPLAVGPYREPIEPSEQDNDTGWGSYE